MNHAKAIIAGAATIALGIVVVSYNNLFPFIKAVIEELRFVPDAIPPLSLIGLVISWAVLVAIISVPVIFVVEIWDRNHRLEIIYDHGNKRCHQPGDKCNEGKPCYYTCLIIKNKSNKEAMKCEGRLESIRKRDGESCSDWPISSDLAWEHQPPTKEGIVPVNIPPNGGEKILDIGWINEGEDKLKLRTSQSVSGINVHRPKGTYYYLIAVSSENLGTVKQWFRTEWEKGYDDFKMFKVGGPPARA